jgi:predicted nucleic acid-binding Zn ribbon protein
MNPASQLAAQRRRVSNTCLVCGTSFTGLKTKKYCGNPCRQKAKYQRKKKE